MTELTFITVSYENQEQQVTWRSVDAATGPENSLGDILGQPLTNVRPRLCNMDDSSWQQALGQCEGNIYRKVWRVLEGMY